jgi:acetyl esterase
MNEPSPGPQVAEPDASKNGADLDKDVSRFIKDMGEAYSRHPRFADLSLTDIRRVCERVRAPWRSGGPSMSATTDLNIPTRHGEVRVRVHDPLGEGPRPALVYLHGGGWTLFSLDTHDRVMREYAARAGVCVVGIDYSLSPEAKFPAALEETVDVVQWLSRHGDSVKIDPARIAVGGDSAGGNLALCAALWLRDLGDEDAVKAVILNYAVLDTEISPTYRLRYGGPDYMLTAEEMTWFWENYLSSPDEKRNPLANPAHARLSGLPPVFLAIPECDLLTGQSLDLVLRLKASEVDHRAVIYKGAAHSFLEAVSIAPIAGEAFDDTATWLRAVFEG